MIVRIFTLSAVLWAATVGAAEKFYDFRDAKTWMRGDWADIRNPRIEPIFNRMEQGDGHIRNPVPKELSDRDVQEKYGDRAYCGLLLREPLTGGTTVSSRMSFDYRMAPLIVLAHNPSPADDGTASLVRYWEVVLFDNGINVWAHDRSADGAFRWRLAASCEFTLKPRTIYDLAVHIGPGPGDGRYITIECNGHKFGFYASDFPSAFHAGVIACEGRNRFYDFRTVPDTERP